MTFAIGTTRSITSPMTEAGMFFMFGLANHVLRRTSTGPPRACHQALSRDPAFLPSPLPHAECFVGGFAGREPLGVEASTATRGVERGAGPEPRAYQALAMDADAKNSNRCAARGRDPAPGDGSSARLPADRTAGHPTPSTRDEQPGDRRSAQRQRQDHRQGRRLRKRGIAEKMASTPRWRDYSYPRSRAHP